MSADLSDPEYAKLELKGPGWEVAHPKYGRWFISRDAVVADWKQDQAQAFPGEPVPEPDEATVQIWFDEQITWIEVAAHGKQLERPNMAAVEAAWLDQMGRNPDVAGAS